MAEERLRICIVTTFFPPHHVGGDAVYACRLARGLVERGHEVTVLHSTDAFRALGGTIREPARHDGFETVALERRWPRAAALAAYLSGRPAFYAGDVARLLQGRRFDVIHFQNVSLMGGPGVLRLGEAVKLYTTHEHWLVCPMHVLFRDNREPCVEPRCLRCTLRFRRPPQLWRYTGLLERSASEVDLFLPPSRFALQAHRERGFAGPMRLLAPFVPAAEIGVGGEARHDDRPYFLYVGRLERLKGVHVLIEAFRGVREADLVVAGEGSCAVELRRQAAGMEHVRFVGRLPLADLDALYRGAAALVVPSVGYETFGVVAVEAMARGTPVIVNDLGALPEVVADSDGAGLVYSTSGALVAALRHLLEDGELRSQLGVRAREAWRARWSDEPHFAAYFAAIEEARRRAGR